MSKRSKRYGEIGILSGGRQPERIWKDGVGPTGKVKISANLTMTDAEGRDVTKECEARAREQGA